jgi:hypothetical protein
MAFKRERGDWKELRTRFGLSPDDEVDLHFGRRESGTFYGEQFDGLEQRIIESLKGAQARGRPYVLFRHGWSTSRPGRTTARSIVRSVMRSRAATPLIERPKCVQHESVFLAKVKAASR